MIPLAGPVGGTMNLVSDELLAVLAVLGALDPDQRIAVERRLRRDAGFEHTVDTWQHRLAPLACAVPEIVPSQSLWDRIDAALDRQAEPAIRAIGFADLEWEPWSEGIRVKIFTRDDAGRPSSFLIQMQPGARIDEHFHDRVEECLVIEGDLIHEGRKLGPGDLTIARAGGAHPPLVSNGGGLLYVRYLDA